MTTNRELFEKISSRDGVVLEESLDTDFDDSIRAFRRATSRPYTYKGRSYPAVYLTDQDYGGLTVNFGDEEAVRLIVNLEFYYVYGFFYDGTVYAFQGEGYQGLTDFGFDCTEMPFGDGYTDIQEELGWDKADALRAEPATHDRLLGALSRVADSSIDFSDKTADLLVVLWSLVEGIRFSAISDSVADLVSGRGTNATYQIYYDLAEKWAERSVAAAEAGTLDPAIAVYELHRLQ